jgi:nickel-dependent lactate racemase
MLYYQNENRQKGLSLDELKQGFYAALDKLGPKNKVLVIPPDYTRFHSMAGELTVLAYEYYGDKLTDILPALGTHAPMTDEQLNKMFPGIPHELFRVHRWRTDIIDLGEVPSGFIHEISGGKVQYSWPAQVNKLLVEGDFDLILSVGQVVPHEVIGMANYNKNIFVGTGGSEGINKSHFLGAAYGMEQIMGRANNPVREVLNYASEHFAGDLPVTYVQTVIAKNTDDKLAAKGLFIGDDAECFEKAADLSLKENFEMLDKPLKKVVVYLDPSEFKSTWLGNKSIYRTRMAIADGGELIVLAPGLKEFGEDPEIDELIRKYGYVGTEKVLQLVEENEDLRNNLSAAAHLIHGSSEGRFKITYCPGSLSQAEIEKANFSYGNLEEMMKIYDPAKMKDGINRFPCGSEVFYISNPALGLWAYKEKFQ